MKIIFLDIDWVMIPAGTIYCKENRVKPECAALLDLILVKTWACIVISSTWRSRMEDVRELFQDYPVIIERIIGRTGFYWWRSTEISVWLQQYYNLHDTGKGTRYTISHWIAIDDDSADMDFAKHNRVFVQTDTFQWLNEEQAEVAVSILNQ